MTDKNDELKNNIDKNKDNQIENINEDSQKETVTQFKKRFHLKKEYRLRIYLILAIIFIGGYAFGCIYYQDHFLPHTTINGMNVSGYTYQKSLQKLKEQMTNDRITLTFIDNQEEQLHKEDCGITFNQDNDIQKELKKQNHFLWFTNWFSSHKITINNLFTIDETKLTHALSQLNHLKEKQITPVDAKVEYKDNTFIITKETIGTKINQEILIENIIQAFNEGKEYINIQDVGGYIKPQITSKDESLKKLLEAAKKYCQTSITYQTTTGDVTLDGNTLITWLSIDESGNYYKDDNEFKKQATAFVKELATKINIIGKAKTFTGANGRRLTVSGGNYGYKLQQDKEVEGLLTDINANKKETRTPITTGIQASYENGGLGDTFVEIDMTKQHFWMHKNGKIVLESDIVTGLPSDPNKKTPGGTYYIYFMQRNRTLRGEIQADGKPEYETPVAYWMAFNGGIGLHDATWQSKFGGNVYFTKGSHGCVNLPLDIAAALYDMVKVNIPVVCYY